MQSLRRKRLTRSERDVARAAGLVYVHDTQPGIQRRRAGRHFYYLAPDGARVRDQRCLARIRALAVPPAYEDVWICNDARGHLQATGRDARARKQYRYHALWREVRDQNKFADLLTFGRALPELRRCLTRDLKRPGLPKEKVLAVIVRLLEQTMSRVGNAEYARSNGSFGLTTLRCRHVRFDRAGSATLTFRGKGGLTHELHVEDRRLSQLLHRCRDLPGQELFQFVDTDGARHSVDSGMVNGYLHEALGGAFTAKTFRTWGATILALRSFAAIAPPPRPNTRHARRVQNRVAAEVARVLGNTPAVCKKSYIHPAVFEAWQRGALVELGALRDRRKLEAAALAILRRDLARCSRGR